MASCGVVAVAASHRIIHSYDIENRLMAKVFPFQLL